MAKYRLKFIFAFLLTCLSTTAFASDSAPEFTLPAISKPGEVKLSDYKGHVVYLDFWATWCSPCRKSFPWMDEMQQRYKDKGLKVVAISVDRKRDIIEKFLKEMEPSFTVAQDDQGAVAKAYQLRGMPTSFLIDREGHIALTHMGFRTKERDKLESAIQTLLEK
jgi:thiol-disulfide isomerase/thioredoxin